jgi:membrane protein YdbS with pleckstrin-like domain
MPRTGYEPKQARSPLRMRMTLAAFGLVCAAAASVGFALAGHPGWAAGMAAIALVAVADMLTVVHRMHQGSRYQPGRGIPPYLPPPPRRR